MTSIREAVTAALSDLGDNTRARVVEHFVDVIFAQMTWHDLFAKLEAQKRADALVAGLDKLTELEREQKKLSKPDVVTYNEDGTEASGTYSKERIDARRKLTEQIEKLTKAMDKADDSADFGDLYNLTK